MKKTKFIGLATAFVCALSLLAGCGSNNAAPADIKETKAASGGTHEPLSICNPFRDVNAFIEVVHKYYPEINFEVIPYAGNNSTAYMQDQLR